MDASVLAIIRTLHCDIAVRLLGGEGKINYSQSRSAVTQVLSKHRAHMQPQRKHAYDFDFGNLELIPPEVFKMIFRQLIANGNTTFQQMYFVELARVAQTISHARENKICHGEFDWAEFLLEVDDFDEFIRTLYAEYYVTDSE